jgi:hypothetical protein
MPKLSSQIKDPVSRCGDLPFELSIVSLSEGEKFARSQDTVATRQFNDDVKRWSNSTAFALKSSIRSMVERDVSLSDSLKAKIYYDRTYAKEANRIGFSFAREGIYIHKGAGKGQGGYIGGHWIDRHGERKERAKSSAGLQGTGNRRPIRWFDTVLDRRLSELADIVSEYSATLQVDATNLYIDKI